MDTLCIADRPALQRLYRVAGRFLLVDAHDGWSADLFSRFFDGWYFAPADDVDNRRPDAVIRIEDRRPARQIPPGFLTFDLPGNGVCHSDGAAFFIEFGDSLITLDSGSSAVGVWIGSGLNDELSASVVSYAVSTALRRCEVFELHSGGVREPSSGKGALIVGASGSGKSTLTLQLAAATWEYLSDDVLLLRESGDGIEAWGLRRDFAVTEETLLATGIPQLDSNVHLRPAFDLHKRRLPPAELFPGGNVASCVPSAIFFPSVTGDAETRVEALSQATAMARLIRMCPWASYDKCSAEAHLRVLAQLARQTAAYAIFSGKDLLHDPALAARLILARL